MESFSSASKGTKSRSCAVSVRPQKLALGLRLGHFRCNEGASCFLLQTSSAGIQKLNQYNNRIE